MKFIAILFFVFLCAILIAADTGQYDSIFLLKDAIPFGDKVGHICMYGTLTFLLNFAFRFRYFNNDVFFQYGTLFVLIFSTLEEFSQLLFVTRTFSLYDLAANLTGITIFGLLSLGLGKITPRYNMRLQQTS